MVRTDGWDAVARALEMRDYAAAFDRLLRMTEHPSGRAERVYRSSALAGYGFDYWELAAITSRPYSSDTPAHFGALLWESDLDEAILAFRSAAEMGSELGEYELGEALLWLGQEREGSAVLRRASERDGEFAFRARAILAREAVRSGRHTAADRRALSFAVEQFEKSSHPDDRRTAREYRELLMR